MKLATTITVLIFFLSGLAFGQANAEESQEEIRVAQWNPNFPGPETEEDEEGDIDEEELVGEDVSEPVEDEPEPGAEEEEEEEPVAEEEEAEEEPKLPPVTDVIDEVLPEDRPVVPKPKEIVIDIAIFLDYQFYDSPDAYRIKYHISMSGRANLATALIRGSAEIATEVTGFLAKWPQGQCVLDVTIAKVPYEIKYNQTDVEEADLSIVFKKDINEKWISNCTFMGTVAKPLVTEGKAEKWIEEAFTKASPPISSIVAPVKEGESTTTKFEISEYTVDEEDLGSAKIKGTGVVTIAPAKAPGAKGTVTPKTSKVFKRPSPFRKFVPPQQRKLEQIRARRKAMQ